MQVVKNEDENWDKVAPGKEKKANGKKVDEDEEGGKMDSEDEDNVFGDSSRVVLIDSPLAFYPMKRTEHIIFHVKAALERIAQKDMAYYTNLANGLAEEGKKQLSYAMANADRFQKELLAESGKHH